MSDHPAPMRVQARFTGRVQGVGFRFRAREIAVERSLTGYVMNYPDGSVVLVAEGAESEIKGMLQDIHDSHLGRLIRDTSVSWRPSLDAFTDFRIRDVPR